MYVTPNHGEITIDSSCTGGIIHIHGAVTIEDNSGGAVTVDEHTDFDITAEHVWDELSAGHTDPSTMGSIKVDTANILAENIDIASDLAFIKNIESGEWKIENNQMIFYAPGGAELIRFDLYGKDGGGADEDVYRRVPV